MVWQIDEAVVRGVIDNSEEGRTHGRIWLYGRKEPLELSLTGDCWRDLAGARLRFENPEPKGDCGFPELAGIQTGVVGDMTASRKSKVATVDDDEFDRLHDSKEEIPYEWRNTLYLEWFSESNGRVVIESSNFELEITDRQWQMDKDAEEAQKLANLHAMRNHMAGVIRRREPSPADEKFPDELDEFEWEERLKESDRLTEAYQEVLEKYMDDPESERKEAFVMGWDGLLDSMDENEDMDERSFFDEAEFIKIPGGDFAEDLDDGNDADPDGDSYMENRDPHEYSHPLQASAQELALRAMDMVPGDGGPGTPAYQLVSNLLQVSGKLAGALNYSPSGFEPETGYVLAVLKRCVNWLNEAIASCQKLMQHERDPDQRAALAHIRSTAFEIRDGIIELRRELK